MTAERPFVSIVIPCRNEAPFVRGLVASLLAQDHPCERLEVLFVDGRSTDGTRAALEEAARAHPFMRVLDNPGRIVPTAMNIGIKAARGTVIVRLDAHSEYPADYVSRCVALLLATGAGNVGGRFANVPNGDGAWAKAVCYVTGHRFGVGGGAFRTGTAAGFVDTVPFGTFPRKVFDEVGFYDERLTRNQDNELNARLIKRGYKIAFDPAIAIRYRNQATLGGLLHQAYYTGMWNVYTLALHPHSLQWRRFAPAAFSGYLAALAGVAAARPALVPLACVPLALYLLLAAGSALGAGEPGGGFARAAATFVSYHLFYGGGTWAGVFNLATGRWRRYIGRPLIEDPART
jgi:succinoglycan biosynthesis protein ExoA